MRSSSVPPIDSIKLNDWHHRLLRPSWLLQDTRMTESRKDRYLKALEIAERHGNRFMAQNIRAELRKLDAEPNYPAKPDSSTITL